MKIKVDKILGCERERDLSLLYTGGRNNNVTSSYLMNEGTFTNLTPFIVTEDSVLKSISMSTNGVETWTGEIHSSNVLIPGALLNVTSSSSGKINDLNILIPANSKLSLYCNGSNIRRPKITIELIKL